MPSDANATPKEMKWSETQQLFLDLLRDEKNCQLTIVALCHKAGFLGVSPWYRAIKRTEFREAVKALYNEAEQQRKLTAGTQAKTEVHELSDVQKKFLDLLQDKDNRQLSRHDLCLKAGFPNRGHWYRAIEDPKFRQVLENFGIAVEQRQPKIDAEANAQEPKWGKAHEQLLTLLQVEENRQLSITELCQKAGFTSKKNWYRVLKHPRFRAELEALGVEIERVGINAKPRERQAEPKWGETHDRLLAVLQVEENRELSITDLCQKAELSMSSWYKALLNSRFKESVEALGVEIERYEWSARGQTRAQREILKVLEDEANRDLPIVRICQKAGYLDDFWYKAIRSEDFVQSVEALGVKVKRREYNENGWTEVQQNILDVLEDPINQQLSITEICRKAGYPNCTYWFRALKSQRFIAAVEAIGIEIWWNGRNANGFTRAQQRFLDFLQGTPIITAAELSRQLGYTSTSSWAGVIQDEHFVEALEALGIQVERLERRKDGWTRSQKRLLEVLEIEGNRDLPITEVCRLAGCSGQPWYRSLREPEFLAAVKNLQVRIRRHEPDEQGWTQAQRRLLEVLEDEGNRNLSVIDLCGKARYSAVSPWYDALLNEQFVEILQSWGVPIARQKPPFEPHINVRLTMSVEEELNQDIWDMRRLKSDYPKHCNPSSYIVDFTWIENPKLRQQIKQYLRQYLPKWSAGTFVGKLRNLQGVLKYLPSDIDLATITRTHIERILPEVLSQASDSWAKECLKSTKAMFTYMADSRFWDGPRPPKDLIRKGDMPSPETPLPRPIPPAVLDQLDPLLEQAIQDIACGREPLILEPIFWDAILILRRTGMRFADLAHLEAPGSHNRGGCLGQDADGDWWIHIRAEKTKTRKEHQIPTVDEDGVVEAILRQSERVKAIPDHFGESYLFRTQQGVLTYSAFCKALDKLNRNLIYAGNPYAITPHQFRHTIATDMINNGVDVAVVKEFLGHASLAMTFRYIKVYRESLQSKYQAYRLRTNQQNVFTPLPQIFPSNMASTNQGEIKTGWVEGYEGRLYRFDLPTGLGVCEQPPGLQLPCLVNGQCSTTCPKLRSGQQHLSAWKNRLFVLQTTIETLKAHPGYEWSCQQHEQELRQAEKVIATIQKEGVWDGRIHNSERP